MTIEYIIIIILLIAIVVMIFFIISKNKKYSRGLTKQKNEYDNNLLNQKNIYENELNSYREQTKKNLEEKLEAGELQILKTFTRLFEAPHFHNFTVYHQLEYEKGNSRKKVDFFIVSPKGLFVIESKKWKGTTYIYRQDCHDLFDNTMFDTFGIGSNKSIRVFNAKKNEDNKNQILLSPYTNPIAQARGYSLDLKEILKEASVKNIIIFHTDNDYKVVIDNYLLQSIVKIDEYTYVISDSNINEFFTSQGDCEIDVVKVNELLNTLLESHSLQCNFKMDISNYMEAPFKFI